MTEKSLLLLDPEFEYLREIIHVVGDDCPAVSRNGKSVKLSRLITNCPEHLWVDHKNGDTWDNRLANLRLCTPQENNFNRKKTAKPKSSKYKGVSYRASKKHWRAQIMIDGIAMYLGCHSQEIAAAKAYNLAALKYFGKFAQLNEIPND